MLCDYCVYGRCTDEGTYDSEGHQIDPALYLCEIHEGVISPHIDFTCEDYNSTGIEEPEMTEPQTPMGTKEQWRKLVLSSQMVPLGEVLAIVQERIDGWKLAHRIPMISTAIGEGEYIRDLLKQRLAPKEAE